MRRGAAWVMALALCVGGTAACGDDGDGAAAEGTTSSTGPTTTAASDGDLTAQVDEFCEKSEAVQARFQEMQSGTGDPPTSEEEAELSQLASEALPLMMTLQGQQAQMLPGDAARFQECANLFNGGATVAPPG